MTRWLIEFRPLALDLRLAGRTDAASAIEALLAEIERFRGALEQITRVATDLPHARRLDRDEMRQIAREALADGG